jgi:hypothetical protein
LEEVTYLKHVVNEGGGVLGGFNKHAALIFLSSLKRLNKEQKLNKGLLSHPLWEKDSHILTNIKPKFSLTLLGSKS